MCPISSIAARHRSTTASATTSSTSSESKSEFRAPANVVLQGVPTGYSCCTKIYGLISLRKAWHSHNSCECSNTVLLVRPRCRMIQTSHVAQNPWPIANYPAGTAKNPRVLLLTSTFPLGNTGAHDSLWLLEELRGCYLRVPFQLATAPGFHVTRVEWVRAVCARVGEKVVLLLWKH